MQATDLLPLPTAASVADATLTAALDVLFQARQAGDIDLVALTTGPVSLAAEVAHLLVIPNPTASTTHRLALASWGWGPPPAGLAREAGSDAVQLVQVVRHAVGCDARVGASQLLVQILNGVVTLAGTVSHLAARQCAEQDARAIPGVSAVHNLLKVRP